MAVIKLSETPPVIQSIYHPPSKVVRVTGNVNREGNESYTIRTKDGLANKWEYKDGNWVLTKEWFWR